MLDWKVIWIELFGTTQWLGLDMGFWVSMAVVLLIVILMNVVFWNMRPRERNENEAAD